MTATQQREYRKQRRAGYAAWQALNNAKTKTEFDSRDDVRLQWIQSGEVYDDSYIDTWTDQTEKQRDEARKDLWRRIEADGVWGLVGEYFDGEEWQQADSCWGFVGQDANGYEFDIMRAAMDAADKVEHCPTCKRPRKGAAPCAE